MVYNRRRMTDSNLDPANAWTLIRQRAQEAGFPRSGAAELTRPYSIDLYRSWLDKGHAGEMRYLRTHLPAKEDPPSHFAKARAALVVAVEYVPHPEPGPRRAVNRVALYARGRDYHRWLNRRLKALAATLRSDFPQEEFLCCVDSAPILERDLAVRAGLGWVGKNSCVIDRAGGSLFLLGEIVTTLAAPVGHLLPHDHCGSCTRCLDACPTGALKAPRELDARLCISYLTIEARGVAPVALREAMGDWLFGCDVCQTVCPWNVKAHGPLLLDPPPARADLVEELKWILTASNRELERAFAETALARAQGFGLKRNAMIVAANRDLAELTDVIEPFLSHPKLGELAGWALTRFRLKPK